MTATLNRLAPHALSLLRVASALLLLQHGTTKILGLPVTQATGISLTTLPGIAGLFELIGGVLLLIGLFTRPVAFLLSGLTAVAYFYAHAPNSFYPIVNQGELAALYSFVFFYFIFAGPGPWSIDAIRNRWFA